MPKKVGQNLKSLFITNFKASINVDNNDILVNFLVRVWTSKNPDIIKNTSTWKPSPTAALYHTDLSILCILVGSSCKALTNPKLVAVWQATTLLMLN